MTQHAPCSDPHRPVTLSPRPASPSPNVAQILSPALLAPAASTLLVRVALCRRVARLHRPRVVAGQWIERVERFAASGFHSLCAQRCFLSFSFTVPSFPLHSPSCYCPPLRYNLELPLVGSGSVVS